MDSLIPTGYTKIPGELNTTQLQQEKFDDIQVVGTPGQAGSFLIGKPKGATGLTPITGGLFNTKELQDLGFSNIQQFGNLGEAGSYLAGQLRSPNVTLPDGRTYTIDPLTGQATLMTDQPTAGGATGVEMDSNALKDFAASPNTPESIANLISSFETQNQGFQAKILELLKPTAEETKVQQDISSLQQQQRKGLQNIEGRPIPLEDIGGEQERLVRNTALLMAPLVDQLSGLQTARKGALDSATAALGFQESSQQLKLKAAEMIQAPFIEADRQVRGFVLDLATKYPDAGITITDSAASAAQKAAKAPSFQATMAKDERTTAIKEYQFAQTQGFVGSFLEFERAKTEIAASGKNQLVFDGAGQPFVYNSMTNSLVPYGASIGPGTDPAGAPRTTRHNNLIAAAVPKGSTNEYTRALTNAGIAWSYGDAFPDDPNMVTIRVQGDPYAASRAILSESPALQNWYVNHTGRSIPERYGISNNVQFKAAPEAVQNAIINDIYAAENGTGGSFTPPAPTNGFVPQGAEASKKAAQERIAQIKSDTSQALALVGQIAPLVDEVITANTAAEAAWQFITKNAGAITGTDEKARLFASKIAGYSSLLARAMGQSGTLTKDDIARIEKALPNFGDTRAVAVQKVQDMQNLIIEIRDSRIAAFEGLAAGTSAAPANDPGADADAFLDSLGL